MDRRVEQAARANGFPELWPLALGTLTLVALVWTGALESIVSGGASPFYPQRLAIAGCVGGVLLIVGAWRLLRSRS